MQPPRFIAIHAAAPAKPPRGVACNGCGVCCLAEACPAGRLFTLRWRGACRLLVWSDAERRYHCGLLQGHGGPLRPAWLAGWVASRARRWIAAGIGCDSDAVVEP